MKDVIFGLNAMISGFDFIKTKKGITMIAMPELFSMNYLKNIIFSPENFQKNSSQKRFHRLLFFQALRIQSD